MEINTDSMAQFAKLKKIRSYMSEFEAVQAQNLLSHNGIDAFVEGARTNTALSYIGSALGGVRLLVNERDQNRAKEILEADLPKSAGPWTCSKCFSEVDEGFDICWKCGALRQEAELAIAPDQQIGSLTHEVFKLHPTDSPPIAAVSDNPYQAPVSNVLSDTRQSNEECDDLVKRAWRAAIFGILILPFVTHAYSLGLLAAAFSKPSSTGRISARFVLTLIVDLIAMAILACFALMAGGVM